MAKKNVPSTDNKPKEEEEKDQTSSRQGWVRSHLTLIKNKAISKNMYIFIIHVRGIALLIISILMSSGQIKLGDPKYRMAN